MGILIVHCIVLLVIFIIIVPLQLSVYRKNILKQDVFAHIFSDSNHFNIERIHLQYDENNLVKGISIERHKNNPICDNIVESINQYLDNNRGTVTDFILLKDIVDRNCDSEEAEIDTLTPMPLYMGLVGTMAGVIIGIVSLILSGDLKNLLSSDLSIQGYGIISLLIGVGIAMMTSILGIMLTTRNSYKFKNNKRIEEETKNTFLTWVQANLLPKLNSSTSDVLRQTARQLSVFNTTFAENTESLRKTLLEVNQAYKSQSQLLIDINSLDLAGLAKSNVSVITHFAKSAPELERLAQYLANTNEYMTAVRTFNERFNDALDRTQVLVELKDFLKEELSAIDQRKAQIAGAVGTVDDKLTQAFQELTAKSAGEISRMKSQFVEQQQLFTDFLTQMKQSYEAMSKEIQAALVDKLKDTPQIVDDLRQVANIASKVEGLTTRMEKANEELKYNIVSQSHDSFGTIIALLGRLDERLEDNKNANLNVRYEVPFWLKAVLVFILLLALVIAVIAGLYLRMRLAA